MLPGQAPELLQKTDFHAPRQKFIQDVLHRRDLQVHPRVRSSPQTHLKIVVEFRPARQICENGQDHLTEGQKIFLQLRQYGRQQVIPDAPKEYQARSEKSQQEDQKTDCDGHRQKSSQDVLPRRDLQLNPRLLSSPQTDLEIEVEFRPELQREITSETNYSDSGTQRVIPETPEEYQVQREGSQQVDQNLYRRHYLSVPSGRKSMADERPLKPPDRNIPRPIIRSPLTTPNHFQMPSHNYQLMVSHPAKSRETSNLSSVYLQDQRNRTDSIEQEVVSQGKLGQPERCCLISAVDEKQETVQPIPKISWHSGPRRPLSLAEKQQYMERYLDLWATEPNFVEEVAKSPPCYGRKPRRLSAIDNRPVVPSSSTADLVTSESET